MNNDIYVYTHEDSTVTTIGDFVGDVDSIVSGWSAEELIKYYDATSDDLTTNQTRIFAEYDDQDQIDKNNSASDAATEINIGTKLYIPKDKLNLEVFSIIGKNQVSEHKSFGAFLAKEHKSLLTDEKYVNVAKFKDPEHGVSIDSYPNVSVWMWCRALSPTSEEEGELSGSYIDVTNFVEELDIGTTKSGGNFRMRIAPFIAKPDDKEGWVVEKTSIQNYGNGDFGNQYAAESSVHKLDAKKGLKRNTILFHSMVLPNDLVFIRFETLQNEVGTKVKKGREADGKKFFLEPNDIVGKNYDMIGMVDSNTLSTVGDSTTMVINISGRDLIKPWIDDGSYFYPLAYTSKGFVLNASEKEDKIMKRLGADGNYPLYQVQQMMPIQFALQVLINLVGNVGFIPDSVLAAYGDKRAKRVGLGTSTQQDAVIQKVIKASKEDFKDVELRGIWSIMHLDMDEHITGRRITDASITNPDGSLLNQVWKICQEPFVEFLTDTYGDMFHMVVRQPIFTKEAILDMLDTEGAVIDIDEEDVRTDSLSFSENGAYSWYQLIPKASFIGQGSDVTLAYLPIVYFEEFAEVFGTKRLSVVSNYINYDRTRDKSASDHTNYLAKQASEDMKFLIETNMYLPFTRSGTITMNGDRRIKRGTWIRYKGTGEIFYVDEVQNHFQISKDTIERTTTLTVSRGMVEKYVRGGKVATSNRNGVESGVILSYFDIINTDTITEELFSTSKIAEGVDSANEGVQIKKNYLVNKTAFNFFLKRRQMHMKIDGKSPI